MTGTLVVISSLLYEFPPEAMMLRRWPLVQPKLATSALDCPDSALFSLTGCAPPCLRLPVVTATTEFGLPTVAVTPGQETRTTMTVRNDSDIVEAYTFEVVG